MRVMVLVKATEDSEKGFVSTAETMEMMEAMGRFNDELVKAGIMKNGNCDGLMPSSQGKRVAFDGPDRTVIDGPFPHPRELVTGFWLWEVKDMDEAVAWVACFRQYDFCNSAGTSQSITYINRSRWICIGIAGFLYVHRTCSILSWKWQVCGQA